MTLSIDAGQKSADAKLLEEKTKACDELRLRAEKLEQDLAQALFERNHEKSQAAKQVSDLQLQN